jgi:hypothetical protein
MNQRSIITVIDKMLMHIPAEQESLIRQLTSIRTSALYAAPEIQGNFWQRTSFCLNQCLPYPPQEDWQRKVDDEYRGLNG